MVNVSDEALIEVFGTPAADSSTIRRWKMTWRNSDRRVRVQNFNQTVKRLDEAGVDPLFYQFYSDTGNDGTVDAMEKFYTVFYKDEHYVFFKLHSGIA